MTSDGLSRQERGMLYLIGVALTVGGAMLILMRPREPFPVVAEQFVVDEVFVIAPVFLASVKVDVNQASVEELATLAGIGPVLAERIVAYRRVHGPFSSVDELSKVQGIGPATVDGLRDGAAVDPEDDQ